MAEHQERILITGANGLIGRAALARLSLKYKVYALFRTMPTEPLPNDVIPIVHDLCTQDDLELPEIPSTIIHLAQSSRYRDFPKGALDVFEVNVGATQRLLDWGQRQGVKRFIYASSGGVYGSDESAMEDKPIDITTSLDHYQSSKRCGELLTQAYRTEMTVVVLRFFFVYGPGQNHMMLIPRLLNCVTEGRAIVLQGADGIRINPIYSGDAVVAIEAACQLNTNETINVVGPQELTLREIGMLMGEVTECKARFDVQLDVQPRNLIGNASKMIKILGSSQTTMAEGLMKMTEDLPRSLGARDAG